MTGEAGRTDFSVAAVRSPGSVDSSLWPDDDYVVEDFSLPMLPDLADVPTVASADVVCQTDPVIVLSAPPVKYDVEAQTEVVVVESIGTATAPTSCVARLGSPVRRWYFWLDPVRICQ